MYRDYHGLLGKLIALHVIVLHWENIIALQRDSASPELNVSYKHLSLLQDEHPKLFFGNIPLRSINKITETIKVQQYLFKKNFQSRPSGRNIFLNSNNLGCSSGNKSFLYKGRRQRENFKPC